MQIKSIEKQNKKRILFRADGNSAIGLGHIYRCLAIAERLQDNFDSFFAIRNPSKELKETISREGIVIDLAEYDDYDEEAKHIATTVVSSYLIDIITLDGYFFDTAYQLSIKNTCKAVLICIDDYQPFHYAADIVINHAPGIDSSQISKEPNTKLFLGYDYLLLRKEFINAGSSPKKIGNINSVLVCFGGADPTDFTGKTVGCIANESSISEIIVITGSSYTETELLKETLKKHAHIQLKKNLDAASMIKLMQHAQLAIVPSSTISLEAFACNMLIITGITAQNQHNIYKGLLLEDTVFGIGDFDRLSCSHLLSTIKEMSFQFKNYCSTTKKKAGDPVADIYNSIL